MSAPAADLSALIQGMRPLSPEPVVARRYQETLLQLAGRARTPDELRAALKVRLRDVNELLKELERRGLVELLERADGRVLRRAAECLWGLHPLFLTRLGQEPSFWRPSPVASVTTPNPSETTP